MKFILDNQIAESAYSTGKTLEIEAYSKNTIRLVVREYNEEVVTIYVNAHDLNVAALHCSLRR